MDPMSPNETNYTENCVKMCDVELVFVVSPYQNQAPNLLIELVE